MISQAPVSIGIFRGKDYITEIANSKALELWGRTEEEVLNKPILEAMPELKSQRIQKMLDEVYETGKIFSAFELPVQIKRNGLLQTVFVNFSYEPLYNSQGIVDGVMAVGSDVTEQVLSHQKTEVSEKRFRLLADSMPQHIWTADPNGNLNYYNQSVFNYSGLSIEQLNKDGWMQIVHPDDREKNLEAWAESVATGKDFVFEHRFRRHDGEYRWQLSRAKPQRDEKGQIQMWVGTSTDIHEQKNFRQELEKQVKERTAELLELNESLKKSEERYHLMVEEVQDYAILYLNREGIVENWNTGAEKIKGYSAKEIIGKSFSNFYTAEDRKNQLPQTLLNLAAKNGRALQEGWRVRKDGTVFWANVVITAVHNKQNEVIGFSKVTHDLTAKKEANDALKVKQHELEQKNNELEKMNKELQSFAYISSHDLQEPLRKIQAFASRIVEKEKENLSSYGKDLFKRMQNAAERMQALIDDLLAYSRTHSTERNFKKVNLNDIIEKVKHDLQEEIQHKHATVQTQEICVVNVIPFQFQQLFYNLISNSLKFANPATPLRITIDSEQAKGKALANENLHSNADYCHLTIADNGIGFEEQYNEKIFELFQKLHGRSEYTGTGIGLAIVKKIVENHDGIITANGELGKGARFDIYLPILSKENN
jgi:PAS domain S-box-containing protein